MNILIPTFIIFLLCAAGIGLSLIIKGKPIEKRCASEPDEGCRCQKNTCEREAGK